jgi:uncharacterized protein YdaU (DUF1376 family)
MRAATPPAFQFYASDFLSDDAVSLMTHEQIGAYVLLLCHAWQRPDGLPSSLEALARLARYAPRRFQKRIWPALLPKFHTNATGNLENPRLERVRSEQNEYRERGRRGGTRSAERRREQRAAAKASEHASEHESERPSEQPINGRANAQQAGQLKGNTPSPSPSPVLPPNPPRGAREALTEAQKDDLPRRAGDFCRVYHRLYSKHSFGALYHEKPRRDYEHAIGLVKTYTDDGRLEKMAELYLLRDDAEVRGKARTIGQFAAMAQWCDAKLRGAGL